MKIGIISDSHDNLPKIKKAVEVFNKQKVGLVLHAGDFVAPFSLIPLDYLNCSYLGVFGNNDGEKEGLIEKSNSRIQEGPVRLQEVARNITLVHDIKQINSEKESADLIVYGHTHSPQVRQERKTLLLNPGECGGWLTGRSTIAVVDLENLAYQIINI